MQEKIMQWQSIDGYHLFARKWKPEKEVNAVICLVHGLGEHSGRYQDWADRLIAAGYAVFAIDLRGHGQSAGARGDVLSFDHFADDLDLMLEQAQNDFSERPVFLYGQSMGGMLTLFYLIQRRPQISGAIITSPFLHSVFDLRKVQILMAKVLGRIIPHMSISSRLEVEGLSRDPAVIAAYRHDPLIHDRISARFGKACLQAISYIFEHASEIKAPLLLMHGTEDRINFASGTKKIAALLTNDCTLKLWEGLYHELHNEPEKDQVFDYLQSWLESKIADS